MKMYLISDNIDTQTGMRLAGVDGVVVHEREELRTALETALADKEIGILLLTEKFGKYDIFTVIYALPIIHLSQPPSLYLSAVDP